MDGERGKRFRSFLIGGLVGSAAGLAAGGRLRVPRRPARRETPAGLAAFEQAPCYAELVEREVAKKLADQPSSARPGSGAAPSRRSAG